MGSAGCHVCGHLMQLMRLAIAGAMLNGRAAPERRRGRQSCRSVLHLLVQLMLDSTLPGATSRGAPDSHDYEAKEHLDEFGYTST